MRKIYGLDDYKFGRKNNWRRWAWNQAKKRITVPAKNAIVLYLPSRQNLDIDVAISKGFMPFNMFAVEKDQSIVKKLRGQKVNVINGDICDVISNWGDLPKIDVVVADFCSGITINAYRFINSLLVSNGFKLYPNASAIIINLLRGRDKFFSGRRHSYYNFIKEKYSVVTPQKFKYNDETDTLIYESKKHRGILFFYAFLLPTIYSDGLIYDYSNEDSMGMLEELKKMSIPETFSYKSKNNINIMDSISFNWWKLPFKSEKISFEIKNKVAAAKAIRTSKYNAKKRKTKNIDYTIA